MCDHEGRDCPGANCPCVCMNCQFPGDDDARQRALQRAVEAQRTCPVTGVPLDSSRAVCIVTSNPDKPRITIAAGVWDQREERVRTNLEHGGVKIRDVLDGRELFPEAPAWTVDASLREDIAAVVNYCWLSEQTDYHEQDADGRANHVFRSLQRLRAWLTSDDDYRAAAAKAQGLGPMDEWLSFVENVPHEVEDTGGATMRIRVPLADGSFLHIVRGDDWTDDPDRQHEQDDWVISHYADEAAPCGVDLGAGLTMAEAVAVIKRAIARPGHTAGPS